MSESEPQLAVFSAVLWEDRPEICQIVVGRAPYTLRKYSRLEGLPMYARGSKSRKRHYWITSEVVAFLRATGKLSGKESN